MTRGARMGGVGLLLAAAVGVGCGSSDAPEASGEPARTRTLVMGLPTGVPEDLDAVPFSGEDRSFMSLAGSQLWTPRPDSCENMTPGSEYVGGLVDSWTISDDGKQIEAKLKPDLKSPAGNPITSEDIRWSV